MFNTIKLRLVALVGLPLLVALYFMVSGIAAKYETVGEMDDMLTLSQLAVKIGALVHEAQKERGATGVFMGSDGAKFATELNNQRKQTDLKRADLEKFLESIDPDSFGREFSEALNKALTKMATIDEHRTKVSNQSIPDNQGLALYTQHNASMLDVINLISKTSKNTQMARVGTAYVNFLQGKERAGIERAVMSRTFASDRFGEGTLRKFGELVSKQGTYFDVFRSLALPEQIAFYKQKMSDPAVAEVQRMRDIAFKMGEVKTEGFGVDPDHWFKTMTSKINLMKNVEERLAEDQSKLVSALKADARNTIIMLSLFALAVVMAVGIAIFFIIRSITRPIQEAVSVADRIAEKDLTVSIKNTRKDEIGQLLSAMERMVENLSQTISSNTLAAESVSQAASEQASSLEETSSSLEEMSSMIKQNASNANEANNIVSETKKDVDQANGKMVQLITSMKEISEASNETSKIIKTIDEIAFQTNLLALNAAVEAARAGEAGAGFAVVADEVRNLALRAAEAAQNTTHLIEGTVKTIEEGSQLVSRTNDAFKQVANGADKVGVLVSDIASASGEQAEGIEQINKAVAEMDKVTQQNAATSEEMASSMAMFKIRHDDSELNSRSVEKRALLETTLK